MTRRRISDIQIRSNKMIDCKGFTDTLIKHGVNFFTGVPDSFLNNFCTYLSDNIPDDRHVIAANEGNAVAIAAGYSFGKKTVPLVYMQNSGIGNAVNPLVSLADRNVYSVPIVLLIGWRGGPGSNDREQHKTQGAITTGLMEIMNIPYRILEDDDNQAQKMAVWAAKTAAEYSSAVALIAKKGLFLGVKTSVSDNSYPLSREEAMNIVLNIAPEGTIFSATTGRAARELHALRDIRSEKHCYDFLNVGSMGHASSVAAGIALACPGRNVICFDGDAAAIMHMGSFTTNGKMQLPNYLHIILNNGVHESVGGQPSAGRVMNFTGVAKACGYATVDYSVNDKNSLEKAVNELLSIKKPGFIDMQIHAGLRPDMPPLMINYNDTINQLRNELLKEYKK